jgi:hypothetical protein
MKLYVALTYLDREEWAKGTVWAAVSGAFELGMRHFLRSDGGDSVAAHVALYFDGATERMRELNATQLSRAKGYSSFCIDILQNNAHAVSSFEDPLSWYRAWDRSRVELYEVLNVDDDAIERAHSAMLSYVANAEPYDCFKNINSIFPWFPCSCSACCLPCCCLCPCFVWSGGANCISATLVGLAAARGVGNVQARRTQNVYSALSLQPRVVLGGRLPREVVEDLVDADQINHTPVTRILERNDVSHTSLPLIAVRA